MRNKWGEIKVSINLKNNEVTIDNNIVLIPEIEKKYEHSNKKKIYIKVKRVFDIILSIIALVLLSPVFLIISIAIKLDSKGNAIFRHKRIGKNGKEIYIYKFRTMVENAEEVMRNFTPEQMKEFKENYKLENDPRITKVGDFLRKSSLDELPQLINILKGDLSIILDELPQLINILKGDLSIIGPRPIIEEELERYGRNKSTLLSVTPGLTGYWAANGRSCTSYEERMKMELYYVENISFKLDMKVFLKTVVSVIKRQGAV